MVMIIYQASQKFCNIFALFKLHQKQPSIQNRGHHVAPSKATFLSFLVLWGKETLSWSFHFPLAVKELWVQEGNHGLEQVITYRR